MKKIIFTALTVLFCFSSCTTSSELKVMLYNIRMDNSGDGENAWPNRKEATIEMIKDLQPDVFGVQEAFNHQVAYVTEKLPVYQNVGVGREDGVLEGEMMSIFWNSEVIEMIEWGTYWLSETPEVPSMGWDAACYRTATWALMKDKRNGKNFYFVNTHLDHVGVEARKNGLQLVVDRIAAMNPEGYPMVLTGDFNMTPDDYALTDLDKQMTSTRTIAAKTDDLSTFNGWGDPEIPEHHMIDYIYEKGFKSVPEYATIMKQYAGKPFISDHYPIISILKY